MTVYRNRCARCSRDYEATRVDARYCSNRCRAAESRERKAAEREAWREAARDLQRRQTALVIAGDHDGLAALAAEAAALFAAEPR